MDNPSIIYLSHEAWALDGLNRFGPDPTQWAFVCPSCGHVATMQDWVNANAEAAIGFSCIGRFDGTGDDAKTFRQAGGPCTYAGGGLINISPVRIGDRDGCYFAFAEATLPGGAS